MRASAAVALAAALGACQEAPTSATDDVIGAQAQGLTLTAPALVKDVVLTTTGASASSPESVTPMGAFTYFTAKHEAYGNELWRTDGTVAGTQIVLDIAPGNDGSYPDYLSVLGDKLIFKANDNAHGSEMWVSDGTPAGTTLLKDINPGSAASSPDDFVVAGSILYFWANDGVHGTELWKTDGTAAGTALVKDIRTDGSPSSLGSFTAFGSKLLFAANDGTNGTEAWISDGTDAGTFMLMDAKAGSSSSSPSDFTVVGSLAFYTAYDTAGSSDELYVTDGTTAGTRMLEIRAGTSGSSPDELVAFKGALYFEASDGTSAPATGAELWTSDGTPEGTKLVKDIRPGTTGSSLANLTVVGDTLYFSASNGTSGSAVGTELWKTDGTADGTVLVKDIRSGTSSSSPDDFVALGSTLYFLADNGTGEELWKSDGTDSGTTLVKDIRPTSTTSSGITSMAVVGSRLYFEADDGTAGDEPWTSDGTPDGTVALGDLYAGASNSEPKSFFAAGADVFFVATDANGIELWRIPGGGAATPVNLELNPPTASSNPGAMVQTGSKLVFAAAGDGIGTELWATDGTEGGTALVKDINPGASGSSPADLIAFGGRIFFAATNGTSSTDGGAGTELWETDGTDTGTQLVKDIYSGTSGSSPDSLTVAGSRFFFEASTGLSAPGLGNELWASDGTAAGTALVKDIYPGTSGSYPDEFIAVGDRVYFAATNSTSGSSTGDELYVSDGTEAGTLLVKDIWTGSSSSAPQDFVALDGVLLFSATTGTSSGTGRELWRTDGTADGTQLVKDVNPTGDASPGRITQSGGRVFFTANDGTNGTELWVTDGTEAGTKLVKDIFPGAGSSSPDWLRDVNGTLFFSALDTTNGRELWKSDGTEAGTVRVKDIAPGLRTSNPESLFRVGNVVLFSASDGTSGHELWQSDGTEAGTTLVADLWTGAGSSNPQAAAFFGDRVMVAATHATQGRELFSLALPSDTFAPYVRCPAAVNATTNTNAPAVVSYPAASSYDDRGGAVTLAYSKASGTSFPVGETTVTVTSTDAAGNAGTCSFKVTLTYVDKTPPAITCPADVNAETEDTEGKVITLPEVTATDADTASPAITLTPASGTKFAIGDTTVTAKAKDDAGNESTCTFKVKLALVDHTDPQITCPANVAKDATVRAGTTATWPDAVATDTRTTSPSITYSTAKGSTFAPGTHEITATATDEAGNDATCTFTVTVTLVDTTIPQITCPTVDAVPAFTREAVVVTYPAATATDNLTESPVITYSKASGTAFELGVTKVTATAKDEFENTASCEFDVTVVLTDVTKPEVTCPADVAADATVREGVAVNYAAAVATDNLDTELELAYSAASGSTFAIGETTVTVTAKDDFDNTASCEFKVNVTLVDTTLPEITCPADAAATTNVKDGIEVEFAAATATDNLTASPVLAYSHESGAKFPVGETAVTASATDEFQNKAECTFKVVVTLVDIHAPVVTCPADQAATAAGPDGAAVTFPEATVTDDIDEAITATYSKANGSVFPVGATSVTATATDAAGNEGECTFKVNVAPAPETGCGCAGLDGASMAFLLGLGALGFRRRRA